MNKCSLDCFYLLKVLIMCLNRLSLSSLYSQCHTHTHTHARTHTHTHTTQTPHTHTRTHTHTHTHHTHAHTHTHTHTPHTHAHAHTHTHTHTLRRRGLNPPHRVKSISMTSFSQAEIDQLKKSGNEVGSRTPVLLTVSIYHLNHYYVIVDTCWGHC